MISPAQRAGDRIEKNDPARGAIDHRILLGKRVDRKESSAQSPRNAGGRDAGGAEEK